MFYVFGGFGLFAAAKFVELLGDIAPAGSGERLGYHLLALVLLLLALGVFIKGGIAAFRAITGKTGKPTKDLVRIFADEPGDPSAFDPDEALAHYMRNKVAQTPLPTNSVPTRPQRGGGGRKPV
jgi:hypothetical protein